VRDTLLERFLRETNMNSDNRDDKRRHTRLEINSAVLIAADRGGYLGQVQDISAGGVRITRPLDFAMNSSKYRLFFIFDEDTVLDVSATLLRENGGHLAFVFEPGQDELVGRLLYETHFATQVS
jgi:PilZ domain